MPPTSSLHLPLPTPSSLSPIQRAWFDAVPESVRFCAAGLIGNAVFFRMDRALLPIVAASLAAASPPGSSRSIDASIFSSAADEIAADPSPFSVRLSEYLISFFRDNVDSVSFFVAYLMSIVIQHALNALIVFGVDTIRTRELYLSSLTTAYTAYFGTLCGSTVLQAFLLKGGMPKSTAFWITIFFSACINYVLLTASSSKQQLSTSEKEKMEERLSLRGGGDDESCVSARGCFGFIRPVFRISGEGSANTSGVKVGRGDRRKRMAAMAMHTFPHAAGCGNHYDRGIGGACAQNIGGRLAALPVLVEARSQARKLTRSLTHPRRHAAVALAVTESVAPSTNGRSANIALRGGLMTGLGVNRGINISEDLAVF